MRVSFWSEIGRLLPERQQVIDYRGHDVGVEFAGVVGRRIFGLANNLSIIPLNLGG
jgi:hypothetical protein